MLLPQPIRSVFDSFDFYLKEGDTLIIGVSGGPDSVFLLHALALYRQKNPITIVVAHVNHGIRGKHANNDERFVKKLAQELQLKCVVKKVKLTGSGLEEKGRKVRRSFFEECAKKFSAQKIVTAHTLNDQLETVILNVIRGAFVGGMAGMAEREGLYYKPLLNVEKKDIFAWLKTKKYTYCIDAMNDDESYARVLVRKKIVPLLQKINPSVAQTVAENAVVMHELSQYLKQEASKRLNKFGATVPVTIFASEAWIIQSAMVQYLYEKITNSKYSLGNKHITAILALVNKNQGNKKHSTGDCVFSINRGIISVNLAKRGLPTLH